MARLRRQFLIDHQFHQAEVFIETGTQAGTALARVADLYPVVHTIEIMESLWQRATKRLERFPHVKCHLGDSVKLLPLVIDPDKRTVLFLDAHFDGVEDGQPPDPGVIARELEVVLEADWTAPFVVLIDDAEKFGDYFWKQPTSERHRRDYWPEDDQVADIIRYYGYSYRVIRHSKGEVWVIEKDWIPR